MTDAQIFQLFGIAIFAVGIGMMVNPENFKKLLRDFAHSPAATFLGGIMAIIAGYLLITFKSLWVGGDIIIAILGWAALIKGFALIIFPSYLLEMSKSIVRKKENFTMVSILCLSLGIIFLYFGYFI